MGQWLSHEGVSGDECQPRQLIGDVSISEDRDTDVELSADKSIIKPRVAEAFEIFFTQEELLEFFFIIIAI